MTLDQLAQGLPIIPQFALIIRESTKQKQMAFIDTLIESGYEQGVDDRFDEDCYIKWSYAEGVIHVYQEGEDEDEWFYVKMTEDCDVITEVTFNPDENSVPFYAN